MNRIDFRFPVDFNDDKDIIEYLINHMNNLRYSPMSRPNNHKIKIELG